MNRVTATIAGFGLVLACVAVAAYASVVGRCAQPVIGCPDNMTCTPIPGTNGSCKILSPLRVLMCRDSEEPIDAGKNCTTLGADAEPQQRCGTLWNFDDPKCSAGHELYPPTPKYVNKIETTSSDCGAD